PSLTAWPVSHCRQPLRQAIAACHSGTAMSSYKAPRGAQKACSIDRFLRAGAVPKTPIAFAPRPVLTQDPKIIVTAVRGWTGTSGNMRPQLLDAHSDGVDH